MRTFRIANCELRIASSVIFIVVLALGILAGPLAADAQQPGKVYRIGGLGGVSPSTPTYERDWGGGFSEGLRASGYILGQHFVMEYRWTDKPWEYARSQAAELVNLKVDLILAVGNLRTRVAKETTSTIPIVMVYSNDPVGFGLVASLARPGGNVTGLTFTAGPELAGKQLQLLKETIPALSRVAVLWASAAFFSAAYLQETQAAARRLGLTLHFYEIRDPMEIEGAFDAMTKAREEALLLPQSDLNFAHARRIAELAAKSRLPTVHGFREAVEAGGLMAYATNAPAMFRRAAAYVDKIFKGANPGDLPVERPITFDLLINVKTAKALGLTIPPSLLNRADEVIQ